MDPILPILSILGYWAIVFWALLEVQVDERAVLSQTDSLSIYASGAARIYSHPGVNRMSSLKEPQLLCSLSTPHSSYFRMVVSKSSYAGIPASETGMQPAASGEVRGSPDGAALASKAAGRNIMNP